MEKPSRSRPFETAFRWSVGPLLVLAGLASLALALVAGSSPGGLAAAIASAAIGLIFGKVGLNVVLRRHSPSLFTSLELRIAGGLIMAAAAVLAATRWSREGAWGAGMTVFTIVFAVETWALARSRRKDGTDPPR